jgi:hypothetical protein
MFFSEIAFFAGEYTPTHGEAVPIDLTTPMLKSSMLLRKFSFSTCQHILFIFWLSF